MTTEPFWEHPERVARFAAREPDHRLQELVGDYPDPAATRVLDLGCAGGRNTVFLAERGFDVVALDSSAAMVAETRSRLAAIVGEEEAARRVRRGRMDDLSFLADKSCELMVALGIFQHAESPEEWNRTLAEAARVLAPGGRLLVATFSPRTDLTGEGVTPVPGARNLYEGFPGGRATLVDAATLDREMARFGLTPLAETATVTKEIERGRRVTVNGLYRKR